MHWLLNEIQVDHAGEMGLTYFRMYQYTGEKKYLDAAINVADVLAKNAKTGSATESVWPYRVVMTDGKITAPYGANWTGCYMLLDNLIRTDIGNVNEYIAARDKARNFLLQYPMKTGYWTDGLRYGCNDFHQQSHLDFLMILKLAAPISTHSLK